MAIVLNGNIKDNTSISLFPEIKVNTNSKYALRFVEDNFFTLIRLSDFQNIETTWRLNFSPHLISEIKLGDSPFSLLQDMKSVFSFSNVKNGNEGSFELDKSIFRIQAGPRYYYKMKRKVLAGESGNNFSGKYFSAMLSFQNINGTNSYRTYALVGWGYQLEVGNSFFLDIGVSVAAKISGESPKNNIRFLNLASNIIEITFDIGRRVF